MGISESPFSCKSGASSANKYSTQLALSLRTYYNEHIKGRNFYETFIFEVAFVARCDLNLGIYRWAEASSANLDPRIFLCDILQCQKSLQPMEYDP